MLFGHFFKAFFFVKYNHELSRSHGHAIDQSLRLNVIFLGHIDPHSQNTFKAEHGPFYSL